MRKLLTLAVLASLMAGLVAIATAGAAGSKTLTATLTGGREVPDPGDPNGRGSATLRLNAAAKRVCYTVSMRRVKGIDFGHIHRGRRGQSGPPVVTLFAEESSKRVRRGCVANVDAALIRKILAHPRRFYVNVHDATGSADFPGGALRGQLRKPASM